MKRMPSHRELLNSCKMGLDRKDLNEMLAEVGFELVCSLGHTLQCNFKGCNCGAVRREDDARAEFLRLWRLRKGV